MNEKTLQEELEKVKSELEVEKNKNIQISEKLQKMAQANSNLQRLKKKIFNFFFRVVEEEEDFIANKLTKKLDELQIEKKRLALQGKIFLF